MPLNVSLLLHANGIVKRFGGVVALRGVSFELLRGEVHALIGENGAGKSTLIKVLTGAHQPDEGTVQIDGKPVETFDPATAQRMGVAAVYQQPAVFADLTVAENLALRLERGSAWRVLRWRQRRQRAQKLLDEVGAVGVKPDTVVGDLGMAQLQLVEIAAAIGADAKVVIFDEPTASLGHRETGNLFRVIRQLKQRGVGMIYVSHRLEELPQIADRVTVLRDGAHVSTRPMTEVDRAELIRLMVGRPVETVFPKAAATIGPVVLETQSLCCDASGVRDVSVSVRTGEILGLAGLVGAGRTELARVLFGITPADRGKIRVNGRDVTVRSPWDAVDAGIAYLPEDRRRHGVILDMSVAQNTTLATLTGALVDFSRERAVAQEYVTRLATKISSVDAPVSTLSGGNQQKVALARWLARSPGVLILDEPTQGVDVGAKSEIHRLIGELAQRGIAIILISSELPEVLAMSDRVAVMRGGAIVGMLERADASPQRVMQLAFGDDAPRDEKGVVA